MSHFCSYKQCSLQEHMVLHVCMLLLPVCCVGYLCIYNRKQA